MPVGPPSPLAARFGRMRNPCVVVSGMRMPPVHGAALVTAHAVQLAPEMSDLVLQQSSWVQGTLAVVQRWSSDRSALDVERARALRQWEHLEREAEQPCHEPVALVIDRASHGGPQPPSQRAPHR